MSDTRTGPQVQKLVDAIGEDMAEAVGHLAKGADMIRQLEGATKGVNGLAAFLKAQHNALSKMIADMEEEAASVGKKMLPPRLEITERVSDEQAAKVREAMA